MATMAVALACGLLAVIYVTPYLYELLVIRSHARLRHIPKTVAYKQHEEATEHEKRKKTKKKNGFPILEDVRSLLKEFSGKSTDELEQLSQTWEDQDTENGVDPPASMPGVVAKLHERERAICIGSSGQVCILD